MADRIEDEWEAIPADESEWEAIPADAGTVDQGEWEAIPAAEGGIPKTEEFSRAVARGVARTGSGLLQTGSRFLSQMPAGPFGPRVEPKQVEKEQKQMRETASVLWEVAKDPTIAAVNKDLGSKALSMIGETIPYITATTLGAIAAGPAGAFAPGAMVEGNTAWRNATDYFLEQNNGAPLTPEQKKQAENIGIGVGLVSGAIETVGGAGLGKLASRVTSKIQNKIAQRGAVFGMGMVVEALEEGGQEIAAITGEETYRDVNWSERVNRTLGAMAGGAFLGGVAKSVGAAGGIAGRVRGGAPIQVGEAAAEAPGEAPVEPEQSARSAITDQAIKEAAAGMFGETTELPITKDLDLEQTLADPTSPITKVEKDALVEQGHSVADVLKMEPAQARSILVGEQVQVAESVSEAVTAAEPVEEPKRRKMTKRQAQKLGHSLPKKLGWNEGQRRDFMQNTVGKRSMANMKPAEMRQVVEAMQEQAKDQGLLPAEDMPQTIFIGVDEVLTEEFVEDSIATVDNLKNRAAKVPKMTPRGRAKRGRGVLGTVKAVLTGIDNINIPHLMNQIGASSEGTIKQVMDNWRDSKHRIAAVFRGGVDQLRGALGDAGITNADLARMSPTLDPRMNLIKTVKERLGVSKTKWHDIKINGKKFVLSMDELMDIYLASLQNQGPGHIESGGFIIRGYRTGGIDEAGLGKLHEIVEADEKAMAVMNAVIAIADNYNAPQINYTHGRLNPDTLDPIADENNYWHLETEQLKKIRGKMTYAISLLENKGILKPRTGGKQALVIRGLFPKFFAVQHAVSEYVGMAEQLRLMNMILNNEDVMSSLETKGYGDIRNNLKTLLEWVQNKQSNTTSTDRLLNKILHGAYRAVLHYSPEVIASQYMSTLHYAGVVDPKYAKMLAVPPTKSVVDEMLKFNPVVWQRYYAGGQSAEMAELGHLDTGLRLMTGKHADLNKTGIAAQLTDLAAFAQGWKLAKAIVKDSGIKEDNQLYWDHVNQKAEELWDTQPSWDKWGKSINTSQRGLKRVPFLFRSYFEKSLMMLHSANAKYEASEKTKADRAKQAQVYGAVIGSQMATALIRTFIGAAVWRKRKDVWDYLGAMTTAPLSMVSIVGGYLGRVVGGVIKILAGEKPGFTGEPLSSLPGQTVEELLVGSKDLAESFAYYTSGDEDKAAKKMKSGTKKIILNVGTMLGIPAKQINKIINALETEEAESEYGGGYLL